MHSVVDLTQSPHHDASSESVGVETAQQKEAQGHSLLQPQPKLGPQAAAALQAGGKRKLPDSFRTHPSANPKQTKQKGSQDNFKPKHAAPPTHRQPATRIAAQAHAVDKEAAHTLEKASDDTLHGQAVLNNLAPTADTIEPYREGSGIKLASQANRCLPESLAGPNKPGLKPRTAGTKVGPTALSLKAGPSEHDTKVYSCPIQ